MRLSEMLNRELQGRYAVYISCVAFLLLLGAIPLCAQNRDFIDQGVIGLDVFKQFANVIIDFQAKEIELVPFAEIGTNATH